MIRSLCVVKDEIDVIDQCLTAALTWSDEIVLLDNGSTDGTWEAIHERASQDSRLVIIGQDTRPFNDGMRVHCYEAVLDRAEAGDWWCRLDADEFYAEDPRAILMAAEPDAFSVWSASLVYYFADLEVARYEADPAAFADGVPVEERCRYYLNHQSEPRFFRHDPRTRWREEDSGFPPVLWRREASPRRIITKNYRYRSPMQIQRRLDARRGIVQAEFSHERVADWADAISRIRTTGEFAGAPASAVATSWRERIAPVTALDFDTHDGAYVIRPDLMPSLPSPLSWREDAPRAVRSWAKRTVPASFRSTLNSLRAVGSRTSALGGQPHSLRGETKEGIN